MIKHTILAAGLLVIPLQAPKANWLDDIAVSYGCQPRAPNDNVAHWYCDGRDHSPAGLAAEDRRAAAAHQRQVVADPHSVNAVMKRLRAETQPSN